jgi:hypothetical protein
MWRDRLPPHPASASDVARVKSKAMVRALALTILAAVCLAATARAQPRQPDPVDLIVRGLEETLNSGSPARFPSFFAPTVPQADVERYRSDLFPPGLVRAVVRERDRGPLEGVPEGDGYSLVVEFFVEQKGRAKILTTGIDVRRPPDGDAASWRIVAVAGLNSVEGLHKLRLNTTAPLAARQLEIAAEDLVLALADGTVFLVESDDGITGLVLIGRGEMRFSPPSAAERGQLRIYSDKDELTTPFETAFVRLNPSDYTKRVSTASLAPTTAQPRLVRRAQEVFERESPKSFSVDLQDLSRDDWHLLPPPDDFLAEIDTRRFDTLTYSRASAQAEDISLFERERRRTIALYPSVAKLAARGRFYTDDVLREYDVIDYNVDTTVNPVQRIIQGRTRLAIRVRATYLATIMLRLAEPLAVSSVTSVEFGRLLFLRLRGQNAIIVNLPRAMQQDSDLTLVVSYSGRLSSQELDVDAVQVSRDGQEREDTTDPVLSSIEPHMLLSNRSWWYPQNPVPDYATASLRITVPDGYRAVASGQPVEPDGLVSLRDILSGPARGQVFNFRAGQPLRYLAVVVSRLTRVGEASVPVVDDPAQSTGVDRVAIAVETTPRQRSRGKVITRAAEDIVKFYTSIVGDAPYTSATIAVLESELPGGHSPGYFAMINDPVPTANTNWRGDPAAFESFPDFFLAHELAHQWWGQAVGWKNYHEQWLSEGFSQYFAALYARQSRGERTFNDMLRQFRRWGLSESDQGPIYLGYRLGHIKSDLRVFRALVYNKGASVLHMLRRLLGDERFFAGLRRFYHDRRYQKAGTDDFERALEAESGLVLDRFFERWIYGTEIPRVTYRMSIRDREVLVRFEQLGNLVFDFPVTVTLTYVDGRVSEVVVPVTDKVTERTLAADGPVRQVQVNRDSATLAELSEAR